MTQPSKESASPSVFSLRQSLMDPKGSAVKSELSSGGGAFLRGRIVSRGTSVAALTFLNMAPFVTAQEPVAPAPEKPRKPKPAADGGAVELAEVTVTDQFAPYRAETVQSPKYTEKLLNIPQTINVVPQKVIEEQNATNLREVLRNVPGISIQAGEGGVPAGDNLSIRGFNARTDLFVDGVRDTGGYARDSFNFEQVEVVKGPSSSYNGRGSTGGSVNIATKAPRTNAFYRGEAGIGTDQYRRFTIDLNQPISLWKGTRSSQVASSDGKSFKTVTTEGEPTSAFRLNAVFNEADYAGRDEVRNKRWGVAPSFAIGLGTPTTITFSYMFFETDGIPDYGIPWVNPANVPLRAFADQPAPVNFSNWYGIRDRDYEKTRTQLGTIQIAHTFNEYLNLRYLTRYGRTERDSMITAPRFQNNLITELSRQLQSRDQTDTIFANQLDLTSRFNTWGLQHTLVTGVEYGIENSKNYLRAGENAPLADLKDPDPWDNYTGRVRRTGAINEADTESAAIYAFDNIKIGKHWEVTGGLRYDYFSVDYDQRDIVGAVTGFDQVDRMLSWRGAVSYKPVENGTIYAAVGTSFNPSAEGLTISVDNDGLDPEKALSYEIGTKWELLDNRLSIAAALFRTEKTNARTPASPIDDDAPNVLEGEQLVQGFEIGITGNLTKDWAIYAGYTFLHSEITKSNIPSEEGNELPNTPQNTFNIWTTYALTEKLTVGFGAQFVDSRFSAANNLREAPSYWTVDAMVAYQINEHFDVRLNVYNISDEEYIDRVGGGHFVPGPARSATLTAAFKF